MVSTTTVYRFKCFDQACQQFLEDRRYATREAIERLDGQAIDGSGILVAAKLVSAEGFLLNPDEI
jgi:hypothetical protein